MSARRARIALRTLALCLSGPAAGAPLLVGAGGPLGFGDAIPDGTVVALDPLFPRGVAPGGARAQRLAIGADGVLVFDGEVPASVDAVPASPAIAACWADAADAPDTLYLASGDGWLLVTWHRTLPAQGGDAPNSFQALLTQHGDVADGELQVELRYAACGWAQGAADDPAGRAGILGVDSPLPLPGGYCQGENTGVPGLWRLGLRGGVWGPCDAACVGDEDADGIPAALDNCALLPNPDQADQDGDGLGDICDVAGPQDAVNPEEICPGAARANPGDLACEEDQDPDRDGVVRPDDNCPMTPNPDQGDLDGDGVGDVCDDDQDGDDVLDRTDVCPRDADSGQRDLDRDGVGDACDDDRDGDGVPNGEDGCPDQADAGQADQDADGVGDACDADVDGDGVPDAEDVCPRLVNPDQADADGDGVGDACDGDVDGDGVADGVDTCPGLPDPEQRDLDGDRIGDACDPDVDGDGIPDADDTCPRLAN
ncbi:MAG: thrombospondin type 3 repeat-containing protein, partial [bacterium]